MTNEINSLFELQDNLSYPDSMLKIKGEITGHAFFPGGKGTFDNSDKISDKQIMILGQDFDSEKNHGISLSNGKEDIEKNPTWRNLLSFLKSIGISQYNCFFTNAILGIRVGEVGTGKSPAFKNTKFMKECRDFFLNQISVQKPTAIFVLGKYTAEFLSQTSTDLECWRSIKNFITIDQKNHQVKKDVTFSNGVKSNLVLLTHPSFRPVNIHRRRYNGLEGDAAEIAMAKLTLF